MSHPVQGNPVLGTIARETDGFNARRLVPDSDSRDCFWLLVPHSSMAASTVTDPSSQGATTRHAARRRGSDTRALCHQGSSRMLSACFPRACLRSLSPVACARGYRSPSHMCAIFVLLPFMSTSIQVFSLVDTSIIVRSLPSRHSRTRDMCGVLAMQAIGQAAAMVYSGVTLTAFGSPTEVEPGLGETQQRMRYERVGMSGSLCR